jgi:hypothetical protein
VIWLGSVYPGLGTVQFPLAASVFFLLLTDSTKYYWPFNDSDKEAEKTKVQCLRRQKECDEGKRGDENMKKGLSHS